MIQADGMKMMQVDAFGGPEVFRPVTAPDPIAGPGQVVIDVAVAGVLSVDAMIRRGEAGDYFTIRPPYVPGAGVAGQVRSVGAGVAEEWVGRRVLADLGGGGGGYASQAVAAESALVPVPDGLGMDIAMALLHDGATALGLLERTPVRRGDTVLIQPAAGGLGTLLVQLARSAGARVIGAARGASTVIPPAEARDRGISRVGMEQLADLAAEIPRRAVVLLAEAAAGRLRPVISRTYPLDQAARAHAAIEAREVLGKSLLVP